MDLGSEKVKVKGRKRQKEKKRGGGGGGGGAGAGGGVSWGVITVCWLLERVSTPKIS